MAAKEVRFWMVWNPQGHQPRHRHFSRADAEMEAERLARANPQHSFYVLKAVCGKRAQNVPVDQIKLFTDPEAIPF